MKTPEKRITSATEIVVEDTESLQALINVHESREKATRAEAAARLEQNANDIFLQAVVAAKRLREFTPWIAELLRKAPSDAARAYLSDVLNDFYNPALNTEDEIAQLRLRLAFTEEVVNLFFRRILTDNFAQVYGRGDFDRDFGPGRPFTAPVAHALEHADAYGLTVTDIRVGGCDSGHVNGGAK